jgi:hypothetical protein
MPHGLHRFVVHDINWASCFTIGKAHGGRGRHSQNARLNLGMV